MIGAILGVMFLGRTQKSVLSRDFELKDPGLYKIHFAAVCLVYQYLQMCPTIFDKISRNVPKFSVSFR